MLAAVFGRGDSEAQLRQRGFRLGASTEIGVDGGGELVATGFDQRFDLLQIRLAVRERTMAFSFKRRLLLMKDRLHGVDGARGGLHIGVRHEAVS